MIRGVTTVTTEAELDVLREELYDWFNASQAIIPVILADQLMAINTDVIGGWERSGGRSGITDFDKVVHAGG
mgnify:FL=1